jgi:hypothetical protein
LKVFPPQAGAAFGVVAKASGAERRCPNLGKPSLQPITLFGDMAHFLSPIFG